MQCSIGNLRESADISSKSLHNKILNFSAQFQIWRGYSGTPEATRHSHYKFRDYSGNKPGNDRILDWKLYLYPKFYMHVLCLAINKSAVFFRLNFILQNRRRLFIIVGGKYIHQFILKCPIPPLDFWSCPISVTQ